MRILKTFKNFRNLLLFIIVASFLLTIRYQYYLSASIGLKINFSESDRISNCKLVEIYGNNYEKKCLKWIVTTTEKSPTDDLKYLHDSVFN